MDPVSIAAVGWAISTAGWIISPLVTKLVNRASALINFDVPKKMKDLETSILPRLALTAQALENSRRPELEKLVTELKSALYEVEDILDEADYYRLQKQMHDQSRKGKKREFASDDGAGSSNQDASTESSFTAPGTLKADLKKLLNNIEKLIDDAERIISSENQAIKSKDFHHTSNIDTEERTPALAQKNKSNTSDPSVKVIGRDESRKVVRDMLRATTEQGDACYSVICIHGMPGSGKTTLAQHVCQFEENDNDAYFDLVMWIEVNQNFVVDSIYERMVNEVKGKTCPSHNGPNALNKELKGLLREKRFLLVLDDVWYDKDSSKLQQLLSPLQVGKRGSKIIVTSRTTLSDIGLVKCIPFKIPEMDSGDFFQLFMHYSGINLNDIDPRKNIGEEIAKKLKLSPLAATIVGGRLRRYNDVSYWVEFNARENLDGVMDFLWWSFQHFDENVRRCFAYCSIFPRKYHLKRGELVKLWVTQGFVNTIDGEEMEIAARRYFDDLLSASFLQPLYDHNPTEYFTMHDLVHDLAKKVSGKECFTIENDVNGEVPQDARHLFIVIHGEKSIGDKVLESKELRTLIINHTGLTEKLSVKVFESVFTKLPKLRVLILNAEGKRWFHTSEKAISLPRSIGKLKHLRYFAFVGSGMITGINFPPTFAQLYHLEVIDVKNFKMLSFSSSEDISNLINLRHVITYPKALDFSNIGRLESLRTFEHFTVKNEEGHELSQLKQLDKLHGELNIYGLENVSSKEDALQAELHKKKYLTEMQLEWNWNKETNDQEQDQSGVIEDLRPPLTLQTLSISGYKGSRYPGWMLSGGPEVPTCLQHLTLTNCSELGPIPNHSKLFRNLYILSICHCRWNTMPDMEHLNSLMELEIKNCNEILSLQTLPQSLKKLMIEKCENLESLPKLPQSLRELMLYGILKFKLPAMPPSLQLLDILTYDPEFAMSCETEGHENWEKIHHIPNRSIKVGWGISAAGWLVSPIIINLLSKGYSYLGFDFDRSEKRKELETKILELEQMLEVVKESPHMIRLNPLLKKLRSTFYEAEDILDDVLYYHLESKILFQHDERLDSDGIPPHSRHGLNYLQSHENNQTNGTTSSDAPAANDVSKLKLKKNIDEIEDIINEAHKVLLVSNLPSHVNVNMRQNVSAKSCIPVTTSTPPPVVIGRDKDRDNIIAMLHEKVGNVQPGSNMQSGLHFPIIGIHGIPGSGKSTLAQLVCASEEKDKKDKKNGHFDFIIWVHVSQKFSVDTILTDMLEAATGERCDQLNNENKLKKKLSRKRFLLVLDDIWYHNNEHKKDLWKIVVPLLDGKADSKILVTSRSEQQLLDLGACICIPISDMDEMVFLKLFMYYALEGANIDGRNRRQFEDVGAEIAEKLKKSPLAARTVGAQLRIRPNIEFWKATRDRDLLNETRGALWWSYQLLDEQIRRCFSYCSIFPRGHLFKRDELVNLWAAEGFIRNTTNTGNELEAVGGQYFDELVSSSFLMKRTGLFGSKDYFTVHDLLHDLAKKIAGSDCFTIQKGWIGDLPPDVRHLFIEAYDNLMIPERILDRLGSLRTLIIFMNNTEMKAEETVFESIFTRMTKLRVLRVEHFQSQKQKKKRGATKKDDELLFPKSIGGLKHLRYFGFRTDYRFIQVVPSEITKLYHLQVLDLGLYGVLEFSSEEDLGKLINLRHFISSQTLHSPNFGKLFSLQTIPTLQVNKEVDYGLEQLKHLNNLRGKLEIYGLPNVECKDAAVQANLAAKEHLNELVLEWFTPDGVSCRPDVQAEVMEGLCPPTKLQILYIRGYEGSRYPSWLIGRQNGPKYLNKLVLYQTRLPLGSIPEHSELFSHLRSLMFFHCFWDSLPDNMECLTSLEELILQDCNLISSLPALPQSLETFHVGSRNRKFIESCRTIDHPNWKRIKHIKHKFIVR